MHLNTQEHRKQRHVTSFVHEHQRSVGRGLCRPPDDRGRMLLGSGQRDVALNPMICDRQRL